MSERLNLVTGATGFSGSYTLRGLLARGQRVVATDLPYLLESPAHRALLSSYGVDLEHPNLEIIPANLLVPESLDTLFRRPITHIFHTASLYDYSASLHKLRQINVQGTRNLLAAMYRSDIALERFIHWSTCGVFGKPFTAAQGDKVNIPFDEDSPSPKTEPLGARDPQGTRLVNVYSRSKWEQEQLMWHEHHSRGLPLTVVRPAPIYGPGSDYGHGGIILAIAMGLVPAIPSDARNYITTSVHVQDVADFAIYIADQENSVGEDYNIVDNSIISYHEFLHYIALLTGRRMRDIPLAKLDTLVPALEVLAKGWTWLENRFAVPRVRVFEVQSAPYISSSYWLSNRKSLRAGYSYHYSDVREGLKDTVHWFRKQGWLTARERLMVVSPGGSKPS